MRLSVQLMLANRYGLSGAMYRRLSSLYALGWSVNSVFSAFADTTNGIFSNFYSVVGITLFSHRYQQFRCRAIMDSSAMVIPLISMFASILAERWNMNIGIPDHAVFVVGSTFLFEMAHSLLDTPTLLLMSHLAARGSDSLSMAVLAGVTNLSCSLSAAYGHVLNGTLCPIIASGTCEYSNAPWLVTAGHFGSLPPSAARGLPAAAGFPSQRTLV